MVSMKTGKTLVMSQLRYQHNRKYHIAEKSHVELAIDTAQSQEKMVANEWEQRAVLF